MSTRRNVAERALTPRSLIASLLLGRHPPAARAALLVRWCALFGVSETSARVALTRMVQGGELLAEDARYSLAGRIRGRQAEQDFALRPVLGEWDGGWVLAVVRAGARGASERATLRGALGRFHMVPVRDGVWARPDNLARALPPEAVDCIWFRGARLAANDADDVVRGFRLDAYERTTVELLARVPRETRELLGVDALPAAFVALAATAQHLRGDPLLPAPLLPREWHADELRDEYRRATETFGAAVAAWSATS